MDDLVSIDWLKDNLGNDKLIVLESNFKSNEDYGDHVIPGARTFDLRIFKDQDGVYPNTIPSPEYFQKACQELGLNQDAKLVVYDTVGIYSSPRAWWLFKTMGFENIAVLNGGIKHWIDAGFDVEARIEQSFNEGDFQVQFHPEKVKYYTDILENINSEACLLLDARSKGRFEGNEDEPRKSILSGSIPKSMSLAYTEVLNDFQYKSQDELIEIFEPYENDKVIFSCGSGITACIILLARELTGKSNHFVFDGSWTEWAERQGLKRY